MAMSAQRRDQTAIAACEKPGRSRTVNLSGPHQESPSSGVVNQMCACCFPEAASLLKRFATVMPQ